MKQPSGRDLTDLQNVTIMLGEELGRVGIHSPRELSEVGAEQAWQRLRAAGFNPDAHTLLALEGAVQNVPWRSLASPRREELLRVALG